MWFSNLRLYRLPAPWGVTNSMLEEWLQQRPFSHCGNSDMQSLGWVSPQDDSGLVYSVEQQWLLALASEQKLLPAGIIKQFTVDKAAEIESTQGYAPGRKQMREIRENVTAELLPRAFALRKRLHIWINPAAGWLGMDTASASKADAALEVLSQCCEALPLSLLQTQLSPATAMSEWLASGEAPAGFSIDQDCELKSASESKATVRYVHHPLEGEEVGEEIKKHLAFGKRPTRLALTWNDRISFILTENLEIKRLAFLDLLKEEASGENASEQFAANIAIMSGELSRMIPDLINALGGETPAQS